MSERDRPPSSPAPHLQSLLSKMRQQGAKSPKPPSQSGGRDETMSTASGAGQSDTEGAAPVGSDAHAASQPQVENISIVDRFSTTVTGSGRTAEEFTSRLFREIAAQHQLQVLTQRQLHQQQLSSLQRELELHGLAAPGQALTAANVDRLGSMSVGDNTPDRDRNGPASASSSVYQTPAAGDRVTFHSPVDTPDSRAGASRGTEESPPLSTSHLRPASQPTGRPPLSPGRTRPQVSAIEARLADYAELTRQKLSRDLQAALQRAENAESRIEAAELSRDKTQQTLDRLLEYQVSVQQVLQDLSDELRRVRDENDGLRLRLADESAALQHAMQHGSDETHARGTDASDALASMAEATAKLEQDLREERGNVKTLERTLAKLTDDLKDTRLRLASTETQRDNLLKSKNASREEMQVLEAKVADLEGERGQLRDKIKELEKALDRMKWPPGTVPDYDLHPATFSHDPFAHDRAIRDARVPDAVASDAHARDVRVQQSLPVGFPGFSRGRGVAWEPPAGVASSVDGSVASGSILSFPRAPHANEETDFNIFTGEPKRAAGGAATERARRNRLHPETRMAWASTSSTAGGSPARSARAPASYYPSPSSLRNERTRQDVADDTYAIEKLLRERLTDIRTERDLLRRDLRTGYTDATAQIRAESRVADLDKQILEVEAALSRS